MRETILYETTAITNNSRELFNFLMNAMDDAEYHRRLVMSELHEECTTHEQTVAENEDLCKMIERSDEKANLSDQMNKTLNRQVREDYYGNYLYNRDRVQSRSAHVSFPFLLLLRLWLSRLLTQSQSRQVHSLSIQ